MMPDPDPLARAAADSAAALAARVDHLGGRLSAAFPADVRAWELLAAAVAAGRAYGRAVAKTDDPDQTPSEPDMLYAIGRTDPYSPAKTLYLSSLGGLTEDVSRSRKMTTAADAAAAAAAAGPEFFPVEVSRTTNQYELPASAPDPATNGHAAPPCDQCGGLMAPIGRSWACTSCGRLSGDPPAHPDPTVAPVEPTANGHVPAPVVGRGA
jgi:hypothetical protein